MILRVTQFVRIRLTRTGCIENEEYSERYTKRWFRFINACGVFLSS